MSIDKLQALEDRNTVLINKIASLETQGHDGFVEKQEFHENKLEMIRLIKTVDTRNGITAKELIQMVKDRPPAIRYETGIYPLDRELNGGFAVGSLAILGGGSFVGKTHITLEILTNVAKANQTVFFNFEMGDTKISQRLQRMKLNDTQLTNLIIDKDSRNLTDIETEIILYARSGCKFFVIDSKMKIEVSGHSSMNEKSSHVTHTLSKIAQKYDIIILLINQISEENLKSGYFGFKGSGDQLYDADYALFYTKDDKGVRTMLCTKNRIDEKEFSLQLKLHDNKTIDYAEVVPTYSDIKETEVAYMPTVI